MRERIQYVSASGKQSFAISSADRRDATDCAKIAEGPAGERWARPTRAAPSFRVAVCCSADGQTMRAPARTQCVRDSLSACDVAAADARCRALPRRSSFAAAVVVRRTAAVAAPEKRRLEMVSQ